MPPLKHPVTWGVVFTIAIVALGLWIGSAEHCFHDGACVSKFQLFLRSDPNEVGDTLAGFAGALAFVWIIVTVWLQSLELAAQRAELVLTRREMAEQRKATQDMAKSMAAQSFNSFVFEMINTLNSIVSSMDVQTKDRVKTIYNGRDCFRFFYKKISDVPTEEKMYPDMVKDDPTWKRYEDVYSEHRSDLGHYFRFVFNMLRVVDSSPSVEPKHRKLIRALFSDDELLVLFYNTLSERGQKFIPYIESFELFDNLPTKELVRQEHKRRLSDKCFGEIA